MTPVLKMKWQPMDSEKIFAKDVTGKGLTSLVHGDDPERCYGEGGGRGVHVWERM